ncbi:MAG TPA: ATP-binding protein, partial [Burkholderiaceae bacterium]|nr:ATP-binding protein [Burkholderiaceae bacterium]
PRTPWPALAMPTGTLLAAQAASAAVGVVSVQLDDDGRLRRMPLLHEVQGHGLPSLPLAVLQAMSPDTPLEYRDGRYRLGAHRWPVDERGRVVVKLPPRDAIATTGFQRVAVAALGIIDDPLLRERFAGRVVFVGSSAFLSDQAITPRGPLSGTQLLAATTSALASDQVLSPPSRALDAVLIVIALLPAAALWRRARPDAPVDALLALAAATTMLMTSTLVLAIARVQSHAFAALTVGAAVLVLALWAYQGFIRRANRQLATERAMADAASRAKSEFVAQVSHEIRNPMNSLLGMAELLADTPLTPEQRRYVETFRASGLTLFKLINDLLDLSKIEAGRLELNPSAFLLPELLAEVQALMQPQAEKKGLAWRMHVEPGPSPGVWCDRQRLQQVLVNLAGNALKFTMQGSITITARRDARLPDMLQLTVADTGIGIVASKHHTIFQPYVQGDGGTTLSYGGTGLGLSITKRLIEMMGGQIRVESAPGMGATFLLDVLAPQRALETPAAVPAAAGGAYAGTRLNILLAEDNAANVFLIESLLKPSGHVLHTAANGLLALERFRAGRYDIVLSDVQMPGMDGLTLIREIRQLESEEGRPRAAVIALTAFAFEADVERSRAAGCDDHLAKPISRAALLAAIERHRPSARGTAAPAPAQAPAQRGADLVTRLQASGAIDAHAASERLGTDEALYLRVLAHAQVFLGDWLGGFRGARASGDGDHALRMAHDLKGIAATIGAQQLSDAALELEQALRAGVADAEVEPMLAPLAQRLREVLLALAEATEANGLDSLQSRSRDPHQ